MKPLRIVHTESSLGWGGQEMRILSEAQGMIRRGHDVTLYCPPQARIHAEAPNWGVPALGLPIERKRPRDDIRSATGRIGDDPAYRLVWISALRVCA